MTESEWAERADEFLRKLDDRLEGMRRLLAGYVDDSSERVTLPPPPGARWQSGEAAKILMRYGINPIDVMAIDGGLDGPRSATLRIEKVTCWRDTVTIAGEDAFNLMAAISKQQPGTDEDP